MKKISSQVKTIAAIVIIAALVIVFWPKKQKVSAPTENTPQEQAGSKNTQAPSTKEPMGKTMEGLLQASDKPARGNLMLKSDGKVVYIFTSRDYSSMIGKQVTVTYDGTAEDFRLGDIQEK